MWINKSFQTRLYSFRYVRTVRCTDELRESPNEPDGLKKGWRFIGDNSAMEIQRQPSGLVVMI